MLFNSKIMNSENGENENLNISKQRPTSTPGKLSKTPSKIPIKCVTPGRPLSASILPVTPSSSREAAIHAKLVSTADRITKVASLKNKWALEKEAKVQRHREKRARELKRQQEIMVLAAEQRKLIIEKNREVEEKKKQSEKELLASSLETAAQLSKDLAEKFRDRRRQSIALNNEILQRAQSKERELNAVKKSEQDR